MDPANNVQQRRWLWGNVKAKSAITLVLADFPLHQISTFVDDDHYTSNTLRMEPEKVYRTSSTKIVTNIEVEIETMTFVKDEE